jgi:anti-sigma regulatory factor (Ser/Thr protein kinase)
MDNIQHQILQLIERDGYNVNTRVCELLGVTRQAASNRLHRLVAKELVESTGSTRARVYRLKEILKTSASYPIHGLSEDIVWRELCVPVIADLPENVRDIWHYGITEMVNNAIDHSGAPVVRVGMSRTALYTSAWVADEGEGIFLKIQRAMNLYDPRESILELAKGKFTTDPVNHSGEGIFFSSKVFDAFDIRSGNLHFMHDADDELDVLAKREKEDNGTLVLMRLDNESPRITKEIVDQFASPDEYTFDKTVVPVRLAAHEGEKLVSRSQAKRLTMRFERFRHVILDFDGVSEIGQAFADEVFRVFQTAHPDLIMVPVNTTPAIKDMVNRAKLRE